MFLLLKFTLTFTFSFLLLSLPIGEKHLFHVLHSVTSSYTDHIYHSVISYTKEGAQKGVQLTKGAFQNSEISKKVESSKEGVDRVQSITSGRKQENQQKVEEIINSHNESITAEEEEKLRRVLMQSL